MRGRRPDPGNDMINHHPPIYRLMVIDREIRSGRHPNAVELAALMEVSLRTVHRDLEHLRDSLNAPLEWSVPENGYRYGTADFALPIHKITEGELLSLLVADRALAEFRRTSLEAPLKNILAKVPTALGDEVTVTPAQLAQASSLLGEPEAPAPLSSGIFRALQEAVRRSETLEVLYHTRRRKVTQWRKMNPLHLVHADGEWYLLAWCHEHQQVRVFVPGHVRDLRPTGETFLRPRGFDSIHYLKCHFDQLDTESLADIRIRFDPQLAPAIQERTWFPGQKVQFLTDGGLELTLAAEHADAVIRWVLQWGTGAEILSPPWVRRRARDLLRRLDQIYTTGPTRSERSQRLTRAPRKIFKPPSRGSRSR